MGAVDPGGGFFDGGVCGAGHAACAAEAPERGAERLHKGRTTPPNPITVLRLEILSAKGRVAGYRGGPEVGSSLEAEGSGPS